MSGEPNDALPVAVFVPIAELPANVPRSCRRDTAALKMVFDEDANVLAAELPACDPLPLRKGTAVLKAAVGKNPHALPNERPACVPLPLRKGTAAFNAGIDLDTEPKAFTAGLPEAGRAQSQTRPIPVL